MFQRGKIHKLFVQVRQSFYLEPDVTPMVTGLKQQLMKSPSLIKWTDFFVHSKSWAWPRAVENDKYSADDQFQLRTGQPANRTISYEIGVLGMFMLSEATQTFAGISLRLTRKSVTCLLVRIILLQCALPFVIPCSQERPRLEDGFSVFRSVMPDAVIYGV